MQILAKISHSIDQMNRNGNIPTAAAENIFFNLLNFAWRKVINKRILSSITGTEKETFQDLSNYQLRCGKITTKWQDHH